MKLLDMTDPDELINKPFLPKRFWNIPKEREGLFDRLKSTGMVVKELNLKTTNSRKLFVTLFSTCIKNFKGEICGYQGVLYDVTAQKELASLKEVQQQLHNCEYLLRGVLESTADGILVIDEKGLVSRMNRRFAQLIRNLKGPKKTILDFMLHIAYILCRFINMLFLCGNIKVLPPRLKYCDI
jgi:hypothetical protein